MNPNPQFALEEVAYYDNEQHLLDPMNPMDFLMDDLRRDWLALCVRLQCDPAN